MSFQTSSPARSLPVFAVSIAAVLLIAVAATLALGAAAILRAATSTQPVAPLVLDAVLSAVVALVSLGWIRLHRSR